MLRVLREHYIVSGNRSMLIFADYWLGDCSQRVVGLRLAPADKGDTSNEEVPRSDIRYKSIVLTKALTCFATLSKYSWRQILLRLYTYCMLFQPSCSMQPHKFGETRNLLPSGIRLNVCPESVHLSQYLQIYCAFFCRERWFFIRIWNGFSDCVSGTYCNVSTTRPDWKTAVNYSLYCFWLFTGIANVISG